MEDYRDTSYEYQFDLPPASQSQFAPPTTTWDFPVTSNFPAWPQNYALDTTTPPTIPALWTGDSNQFTPSQTNEEWNPFDASFGDVSMWEQWDNFEEFGDGDGDVSNLGPSFSANAVLPTITAGGGIIEPSIEAGAPLPMPLQTGQAVQPTTFSCNALGKPNHTNLPMDLESSSSRPKSDLEVVKVRDTKTRKKNKSPRPPPRPKSLSLHKRSSSSTQASPLTSPSSKLPRQNSRAASTSTTNTANFDPTPGTAISNESSSVVKTTPPNRQDRSKTEHKYRMHLNDHFTTLFAALPKEYVENEAGSAAGRRRTTPTSKPVVSKIEVLDLAQRCILELERRHTELKEEGLVLKGQAELFKRLLLYSDGYRYIL